MVDPGATTDWQTRYFISDGWSVELNSAPEIDPFTLPAWEAGTPIESGVTRGGVRKTTLQDRTLYLRHFHHGGLLGGLFGDRFLTAEPGKQELNLLLELSRRGIRVPEPVFLEVRRKRLSPFVKIRLATWEIPGQPLFEVLARSPAVRRPAIQAAARLIRQLHQAGVLHGDLHFGNILWDGTSATLLDLDHAVRTENVDPERCWAELLRLLRSALKRRHRLSCTSTDALRFLRAYSGEDRSWEEGLRSRLGQFQREMRYRSKLWKKS